MIYFSFLYPGWVIYTIILRIFDSGFGGVLHSSGLARYYESPVPFGEVLIILIISCYKSPRFSRFITSGLRQYFTTYLLLPDN